MNIRKLLSAAAASVMAMSLLCSCGQSGVLRLGTGNTGGNYYSYGTWLHELDENGSEVDRFGGTFQGTDYTWSAQEAKTTISGKTTRIELVIEK